MERNGANIRILNPDHQWVGSLSRKGVEKWKDRLPGIINAQVLGVIIRNAGEKDLPMKTKTGIEQWSLPIVEVLQMKNACVTL